MGSMMGGDDSGGDFGGGDFGGGGDISAPAPDFSGDTGLDGGFAPLFMDGFNNGFGGMPDMSSMVNASPIGNLFNSSATGSQSPFGSSQSAPTANNQGALAQAATAAMPAAPPTPAAPPGMPATPNLQGLPQNVQQAVQQNPGGLQAMDRVQQPSGSWTNRLMGDLQHTYGLTTNQAAGIVGNLQQESGPNLQNLQENHPLVQGSRGGLGIAQWTGPRRTQFENFAASHGLSPTSYEANWGMLQHDLNGPYAGALNAVKAQNSAAGAAQAFEQKFEGAGIPMMSKRIGYANNLASTFRSGGSPEANAALGLDTSPPPASIPNTPSASSNVPLPQPAPQQAPQLTTEQPLTSQAPQTPTVQNNAPAASSVAPGAMPAQQQANPFAIAKTPRGLDQTGWRAGQTVGNLIKGIPGLFGGHMMGQQGQPHGILGMLGGMFQHAMPQQQQLSQQSLQQQQAPMGDSILNPMMGGPLDPTKNMTGAQDNMPARLQAAAQWGSPKNSPLPQERSEANQAPPPMSTSDINQFARIFGRQPQGTIQAQQQQPPAPQQQPNLVAQGSQMLGSSPDMLSGTPLAPPQQFSGSIADQYGASQAPTAGYNLPQGSPAANTIKQAVAQAPTPQQPLTLNQIGQMPADQVSDADANRYLAAQQATPAPAPQQTAPQPTTPAPAATAPKAPAYGSPAYWKSGTPDPKTGLTPNQQAWTKQWPELTIPGQGNTPTFESLTPQEQKEATGYAAGIIATPRPYKRPADFTQVAMAAHELNPAYNQTYDESQKSFAPNGYYGKQLGTLYMVGDHAGQLSDDYDNLVKYMQQKGYTYTAGDNLLDWASHNLNSDPKAADLINRVNADKAFFTTEGAKLTRGVGSMSHEEQESMNNMIHSIGQNPAAVGATIQSMGNLLGARAHAIAQEAQYHLGLKQFNDPAMQEFDNSMSRINQRQTQYEKEFGAGGQQPSASVQPQGTSGTPKAAVATQAAPDYAAAAAWAKANPKDPRAALILQRIQQAQPHVPMSQ